MLLPMSISVWRAWIRLFLFVAYYSYFWFRIGPSFSFILIWIDLGMISGAVYLTGSSSPYNSCLSSMGKFLMISIILMKDSTPLKFLNRWLIFPPSRGFNCFFFNIYTLQYSCAKSSLWLFRVFFYFCYFTSFRIC